MSFEANPILHACQSNDLPTLQNLLEEQEERLFDQVARNGTVDTAAYILSRHPVVEDLSQRVPEPRPAQNPMLYLCRQTARHGNSQVFRYVLSRQPELLSKNRNVESILRNACNADIWTIILEHDQRWKDHEFSSHRGCVLEFLIESKNTALLEFLLREGADTDRAGDPVLELAKARRAGPEILELIRRYSH